MRRNRIRARVVLFKPFSPEPIDAESKQTILNEISKFLSEPDHYVCEGTLTLAELTTLVKSLNDNKAPGPDGMTVEF